jgi:hypothetical protein
MDSKKMPTDVSNSASRKLPDWTMKYPDGARTFLDDYGQDDRGNRTLEAFNYELIALADKCQGKPHAVFEMLHGWLYEDWRPILSQKLSKNRSDLSAEVAKDHAQSMTKEEMLGLLGTGCLPGESASVIINDEEGMRRAYANESRARYLALRSGVAFSDTTLRRIKSAGYGPVQLHAQWPLHRDAFDRWLAHVFGVVEPQAEQFDIREPLGVSSEANPWLLAAAGGPDADYLCNHLIAWGGLVIGPVELALEAAQIASHANLAGAILEVDWNIEASLVICDILFQRRVPFLAIARETSPPLMMSIGGRVLHSPDINEIRFALEDLPKRAVIGMDFAREVEVEWG